MRDKVCYLDFDGTLVDCLPRMYQFFLDWFPGGGGGLLDFDEYKTVKRLRMDEAEIIERLTGRKIDKELYAALKLAHMEDSEYLALDEVFPYVFAALKSLREEYLVRIVSRRERSDAFMHEATRLGFADAVDSIMCIPHNGRTKSEIITETYGREFASSFVGDTEDDMESALALGARAFFVCSGVRSKCFSVSYGDEICCTDTFSEAVEFILGSAK